MKKIITIKEIKLQLLLFVFLIISFASNAQFVERWLSVVSSESSAGNVRHAILKTSDGNIVASGKSRIIKYSRTGKIIWQTDVALPSTLTSQGFSMASDQAGNIYITAARSLNFGELGGTTDFFVAKYNSDGQQVWSHLFDGGHELDDEAVDIGIDQFGNIYIAGSTFSIGDFGLHDKIYTAKFNNDGVRQWQVTFPNTSRAKDMTVDFFTGDVYVTGSSAVPKSGDEVHLDDVTTIKYNTDGEQQWATLYNGSLQEDDEGEAITLDADGNVLVTGFSTEKINSDFFAGTTVITTFKYDRTNGKQVWQKRFGRDQDDNQNFFEGRALNIATDANDNVVVIGTTAFARWHTIKYQKSDGKTLWIQNYDNDQFDDHSGSLVGHDIPSAIAFDPENNVYVTGLSEFNDTKADIFTIKYRSSDGNELGSARLDNGGLEGATDITVDERGNAYVTGGSGTSIITVSYGVCAIVCPQDISINNDPGKCGAIVKFEATTTGNCGPVVFLEGENTVTSGSFFSVGQHTILVKSESTGETCSFVITVVDNEKPVITQCPSALTVSCAADVPLPDISLVKATDNCEVVTISHAGDVISNQTCANRFTLTRTYVATDSHANTAVCTQIISVNDIVPPQITGFGLSKESLFPPNHSMQDITLNYQVLDNCVSNTPVKITITSNEPVNGTGDGDTDPDWIVVDDHHIQLRAERSAIGNGRIYTITVTADDGCNPPVSVTKQVFVAHNITAPQSGNPFKIGSTVNLAGTFWDKAGNKHSAKWLLDGSAAANGTVTEPAGNQNGKVTGSYKFNTAGVYKLQMNVTDQTGATSFANTNGDLESIVVIYDPNGGYTYGGGYFNSPAGALVSNSSATGKASYGFAVNYKNTSKPQGETQFEFKVGSFEFNALNFDYLVINGAMAQFKGTGKITGGQSGIGFTMTVKDGALDGSGADKIRMKIYNKITGAVIYDNQPGASDAALPATTVGSNSVIVIQGNNTNTTVTNISQESLSEVKSAVDGLVVNAYPNPSKNYFTISVNSNSKEEIMMQVFDQNGRTMDTRRNIVPGSVINFGDKYIPGAYYVRIMQGTEHKEVKLIKIED